MRECVRTVDLPENDAANIFGIEVNRTKQTTQRTKTVKIENATQHIKQQLYIQHPTIICYFMTILLHVSASKLTFV